MADRVKGITIEIGGDTTGLSKALSGVNKEIKDTQTQLRNVERLLKMDPGNTVLLEQKQRLLAQAVGETKTKLDTLKVAEKQVQEQFKKGEISQKQYDDFNRKLVQTKKDYENAEKAAKNFNTEAAKISATASKISTGAGKVSTAFKPATTAIAGLATAAVATVPATEELRSDLSKLDQNARESSIGIDTAREAFKAFNVVSDETDSSVEATSNLLQAGFTESNLQKAVEGLSGAYLRFPDTLKIESLADSLQETLATGSATGQFGELLDRLGIGADNFSQQLANCTTEADKQNLALQTLSEAGLMDTYTSWKENNSELVKSKEATQNFQETLAQFAESIQPVMTMITQFATSVLNWFNQLSPEGQKAIVVILGIVAAISPVAGIISGVAGAIAGVQKVIGPLKTAMSGLNTVMSANPIGIIITLIAALVAAFIYLWNNCEEFREFWINLWDTISSAFSTVWDAIVNFFTVTIPDAWNSVVDFFWQGYYTWQSIWQSIGDFFSGIWDGIVSFFTETIPNAWNSLVDFCWQGYYAWQEVWQNVGDFFSGIWDGIVGFFTETIPNAWNGLMDIFNKIGSWWSGIWNGVRDTFSNVFNSLVNIAKQPINAIIGLINGIIDGLNWMIGGLNQLSFDIPDWVPIFGGKKFGINIPTIGKIPYLASGGILSQGSAVVGEAGPELLTMMGTKAVVQPLTSSTTTNTNLGGVNIVVYGAPGQDVRELADIIMDEMQSATMRKGAVWG